MRIVYWTLLFAFLLFAPVAFAHVGSPDVFYEGDAGPYHLLITVRPPGMIPGIAQVEIRSTSNAPSAINVAPVYLTAKDTGLPPTPDAMQPLPGDPQSFSGKVWLMASGSWEVRVQADGAQGKGELALPVPAFARRTLPMQKAVGTILFALMLFLSLGIVAIAGAAAREGSLQAGSTPPAKNQRRGRIVMAIAAIVVIGLLALGNWWWNVAAADLAHGMLYQAPPLTTSLDGDHLTLRMADNFWHERRKDSWSMRLIPDHGHLMHLFLLRTQGLDRFYHLHPEQNPDGSFGLDLPPVPAGHYQFFADIVRESGFPETMVAEMDLPDITGKALAGDDSEASGSAIAVVPGGTDVATLPDATRVVWEHDNSQPAVGRLTWFRFRVEDRDGKPVTDLEPYMGMAGHAVFVRSDRTVFAHVHPAGSVPMAALTLVEKDVPKSVQKDASPMPGMMHPSTLPAEVSFPYGFPQAGDYRVFVQVKRAGKIETGVFDTHVSN